MATDKKNQGNKQVTPKGQEPFDEKKARYNERGDVWNPYTKEWETPLHLIV